MFLADDKIIQKSMDIFGCGQQALLKLIRGNRAVD